MKEESQDKSKIKDPMARIELLLSPDHKAQLDALVANHPTINTRTAMVRALLDGAPVTQTAPQTDPALVRQLASIGNLLNQYARLANTCMAAGQPVAGTAIHAQLLKANQLLTQIIKNAEKEHAA